MSSHHTREDNHYLVGIQRWKQWKQVFADFFIQRNKTQHAWLAHSAVVTRLKTLQSTHT